MKAPTNKEQRAARDADFVASLFKAYSLLSDNIMGALKARFPTGEVVHWTRRGYRQRGEVHGVLGFQAHNARLRVLNTATGKMVDLYMYEVEEVND